MNVQRARILLALPLALVAIGCASQPAPAPKTPSTLRSVIGTPPANARTSPAVWGAERGLELWAWTVADARQTFIRAPADSAAPSDEPPRTPTYTIIDPRLSIEQAVAPYTDRPVPIADDLRFRLQAAGFRIVAIPVDDLVALQTTLRLVAPTQKQWLGEVPLWTDVIRGPSFNSPRTFAVDNAPNLASTHLPPGRLRLIARAWTAPLPTDDDPRAAALRLELVPQHEPLLSEPHRLLAGVANAGTETQGRLFPRLAIGAYLRGDEALVLIPDSPHSDWSRTAAETPAPTDPARADPEGSPDAAQPDESRLNWPTLGEAMLSTPATQSSPRTRTVLVLIPHTPARFELR
jgi:hypothetical protein